MKTMTVDEFKAALKAQGVSHEKVKLICPMCKVAQSAEDLIAAGAGQTFEEVEKYLGFACVGRWTGAGSPRNKPDGKPCDWSLGGLFKLHELEVITPDGVHHPRFEVAETADA